MKTLFAYKWEERGPQRRYEDVSYMETGGEKSS